MLFKTRFHDPIRRGDVTLTFRRWRRPQARAGGRYRLHTGAVIEVTDVATLDAATIAPDDARRAGYDGLDALLRDLAGERDGDPGDGATVYRVAFRYVGDLPDERAALASEAAFDDLERAAVEARLARMDGGARGPWTHDLLRLIDSHEGVRAADLAASLGRETVRFKADVRRLKALGLTESLDVGYRLSPRGRAFLGLPARAAGEEAR